MMNAKFPQYLFSVYPGEIIHKEVIRLSGLEKDKR